MGTFVFWIEDPDEKVKRRSWQIGNMYNMAMMSRECMAIFPQAAGVAICSPVQAIDCLAVGFDVNRACQLASPSAKI